MLTVLEMNPDIPHVLPVDPDLPEEPGMTAEEKEQRKKEQEKDMVNRDTLLRAQAQIRAGYEAYILHPMITLKLAVYIGTGMLLQAF